MTSRTIVVPLLPFLCRTLPHLDPSHSSNSNSSSKAWVDPPSSLVAPLPLLAWLGRFLSPPSLRNEMVMLTVMAMVKRSNQNGTRLQLQLLSQPLRLNHHHCNQRLPKPSLLLHLHLHLLPPLPPLHHFEWLMMIRTGARCPCPGPRPTPCLLLYRPHPHPLPITRLTPHRVKG